MPENSGKPQITIIVVNFNGGEDILACLNSIFHGKSEAEFEVLVVDNGSTDNSLVQIRAQFSSVKLLELGENRGFAAACNEGMKAAQGRAILLLNPDTEVREDAIAKMHSALIANPNWGIVGAKMLDKNSRPYRAARRFPAARDLASQTTGLARLFPHSRRFNGYLYGEQEIEDLSEVEQIEGSCLMISEDARAKVGGLDERFFIFFEEVEWCKRVREAEFECHVVRDAEVVHKISTTMGRYYERTREIHAQSAMKYFQKHHGETGYVKLRSTMLRALMLRACILALPALLNAGNARKRFSGTLAERRAYRKGLDR